MIQFHVLFSKPKHFKIGSWIIRSITGLPFSHVSIWATAPGVTKNLEDKVNVIYEAVYPKSHIISFEGWREYNLIVDQKTLPTLYNSLDAVEWLYNRTGVNYSLTQILLVYLRIGFKSWRLILNKQIFNADKELICAELVAEFIRTFYLVPFSVSSDLVGLSEIHDAVKKVCNNSSKG